MERKVYILENLGCANCAAKIERKVAALPGVDEATITFATKQLRLTAENPDSLIPEIQRIANSLEPEIVITERKRRSAAASAASRPSSPSGAPQVQHKHDENCGCGHDHNAHEQHHHGHDEDCDCGHEHSEHEHDESCGCGHEHHHHEHDDDCGCGHDHHHHEHDDCGCGHDHHQHDDDCDCGHEHDKHELHHHEHGDDCGCGHNHHQHDHDEACGCGHEHHHHEHGDDCGCGHNHHQHDHDEDCGCGHEHDEHELHHHEHGDDCGCGHDHHQHDHDEDCGCGHEHDEHEHHHHEHDDCGCGHNHHQHDHDEDCGCGHEHHHHEHGDDCGCGHEHHHHEHDEDCGCGHEHEHHHHEHGDDCGCGHDHHGHEHHHHEHSDSCGHDHHHHTHHVPGHPADCQCELCHPHEEYCDVCGQSLANCTCTMPDEDCVKRVYILENLGCANCAAKMEKKIKDLDGVKYASITYTTKQLRLSAKDPDALLPKIQEICSSIESEVRVVARTKPIGSTVTRTYTVENLDCANCAAKMERRINELEGITNATLTFATKQLRVTGKNPDALFDEMQRICSSVESEVKLIPRDTRPRSSDTLKVSEVVPPARKAKPLLKFNDNTKTLIEILIGAVLFIAGEVFEHMAMETPAFIVLVVAYVLLGGRIVLTAVKNLTKGQVFDENFLMSIATLGAFAIREYPEAVGVMLFYRIGELFEHIAVEKSRGQIMDAVDMRPEVVNLVVGDDVQVIDAEEANVGDILLIRPGDRIPLDGVIVEGESRLDTSPVTGEPVPVKVSYGDEVTSGCVNTSGLLKIRVEKVLEESMVTRILDSVENAAASKPKIDRFITRFARIYTPFVVILAACTAIIPSLVTGNWNYWVYTALTFLVMSCPCALVLSVPLAFFSGIGAGSKRGILFKGGVSLEAMKNVDAVIMDKTGTITKGNFVVQRSVPSGNVTADELLSLCASCELTSTHPIGSSIVTAANEKSLSVTRPSSVEEIAGHGIRAVLPEGVILCGNQKLMEKYGVSLENYHKEGFGTEVLAAKDGVFIGHLMISDTIKEDAKSAISQIKKLGIATVMLTGDAKDSAEAVAAATGIDEVHAKLLPQDKLNELNKVRSAHGSVMFVGDGINDAPVLAGADVGAAMGSGADAAIEAADVVFMTSNMEAIPQSLSIARATSRISWQNVIFALIIKVMVMILGLLGFASMWMAVFADTGVAMLCVLNSIRVLYRKKI